MSANTCQFLIVVLFSSLLAKPSPAQTIKPEIVAQFLGQWNSTDTGEHLRFAIENGMLTFRWGKSTAETDIKANERGCLIVSYAGNQTTIVRSTCIENGALVMRMEPDSGQGVRRWLRDKKIADRESKAFAERVMRENPEDRPRVTVLDGINAQLAQQQATSQARIDAEVKRRQQQATLAANQQDVLNQRLAAQREQEQQLALQQAETERQQQESLNERLAAQRRSQEQQAQQQASEQRTRQQQAIDQQAREQAAERLALTKSVWSPVEASFDPRNPHAANFSLITPSGSVVVTMSISIGRVTINEKALAQGTLSVDVLNASRCTLLVSGFLYSKGYPIKDLGDKNIGPDQRIESNGPSGRFSSDANSRLVFKPSGFLHDCQ